MTSRNLAFSWPFFTVFGENFVPSSEEKVRHFERRRAHGPSIGRGYHTDTARPTHSQVRSIVSASSTDHIEMTLHT
jgi:hypothetical protein